MQARHSKIEKFGLGISLCEETFLVLPFHSAALGARPDGQAECDLVRKVSKVVDQVESLVTNRAIQVAKEVAKRIDGPADSDNEAHSVEGGLNVRVHTAAYFACFTGEDLKQDEAPSRQANNKASPSTANHEVGLAGVPGGQHDNSTHQEPPEHACADVRFHRFEDQVELNHLQWNSD